MSLRDKIKGGSPEKEKGDQFVYHKGSISRLDMEPSAQEIREEIQDDLEKELCPRDGGEFKKQADGRIICENCGLVLSDAIRERFKIQK